MCRLWYSVFFKYLGNNTLMENVRIYTYSNAYKYGCILLC